MRSKTTTAGAAVPGWRYESRGGETLIAGDLVTAGDGTEYRRMFGAEGVSTDFPLTYELAEVGGPDVSLLVGMEQGALEAILPDLQTSELAALAEADEREFVQVAAASDGEPRAVAEVVNDDANMRDLDGPPWSAPGLMRHNPDPRMTDARGLPPSLRSAVFRFITRRRTIHAAQELSAQLQADDLRWGVVYAARDLVNKHSAPLKEAA